MTEAKSPQRSVTPNYVGLLPASEAASRAKRANRCTDTIHELLLRRELWRLGLRYRKNVITLPGKPDLVFAQARVVVFCDGDFWHGREWERLKEELARRHNSAYWLAKIGRNRERDVANTALLKEEGWMVIRLWESDIRRNPVQVARKILHTVTKRRGRSS